MRVEIERKFLVANDGWRSAVSNVRYLKDGLIGQSVLGKARVRLERDRAVLTVKGARSDAAIARPEFEYEIPRADAEAMLGSVCLGRMIEKTRHSVPHEGLVWEIDVFGGAFVGIVLAEVELEDVAQPFSRPDWLGEEVTGDPRFRQSSLFALCADACGPVTMDQVLARPGR